MSLCYVVSLIILKGIFLVITKEEKTEYKKFETGDNGTFYLPEKITKGTYSLHNISAPSGYYIDKKQILQSRKPGTGPSRTW